MDNFANIGKSVLIQSIGIQKNYTEVIESTVESVDYDNTACSGCKYKTIINTFEAESKPYSDACLACSNCPHKTLTQKNVYKKIYHNEKNRYGYRPMLKGYAIKLLLLLHFYHPDKHGILHDLDSSELADILGCNIRTIKNNLELLQNYTYISYSKNKYGLIDVVLNDYENYYLPANKGGRGFLVVSKDLLDKIISVNSLIALRICLRELISLDAPELKGQASVDYKRMKDLRSMLPSYCKPSVVKANITACPDIFTISIDKDLIRFEINQSFIPKNQKAYAHEEYIVRLNDFIWEFNQNVAYINSGGFIPNRLCSFFNSDKPDSGYKPILITDIEKDDLASLIIHYSYDSVISALAQVYQQYYMRNKTINNLAGLISTIIRSQLNISKKAA